MLWALCHAQVNVSNYCKWELQSYIIFLQPALQELYIVFPSLSAVHQISREPSVYNKQRPNQFKPLRHSHHKSIHRKAFAKDVSRSVSQGLLSPSYHCRYYAADDCISDGHEDLYGAMPMQPGLVSLEIAVGLFSLLAHGGRFYHFG